MSTSQYSLADLLRLMERLRDPQGGCPWDLQQNFQSIVPSTLEECYELAEAIEKEDYPHVAEELGDVLFQVVFYSQLGREQDLFGFDDVVHGLVEKLLRRHPHVFHEGDIEGVVPTGVQKNETTDFPDGGAAISIEDVHKSWGKIKQAERDAKSQTGIFADVPRALPALPRAQKIQKRAAGVNFDWPDHAGAMAKLQEEFAELAEAIVGGDTHSIEEEMGDLLFSCVNVARHLKLDAEASLRRSTAKFESRVQAMSTLAQNASTNLESMDASALEGLWEKAKGLSHSGATKSKH